MKAESGKRLWLVAWAGKNEKGEGWADSWEPTSFVREQLRRDYLEDRQQRQQRIIDVGAPDPDGGQTGLTHGVTRRRAGVDCLTF